MKYRFKQIQDDLKIYLETGICLLITKIILQKKTFLPSIGSDSLLENIIYEHNVCSKITDRINGKAKYLIFLLYYLSVPVLDLLIIIVIFDGMHIINRLLSIIVAMVAILCLLSLNSTMSLIPNAAHQPFGKLNSLIAKKRIRLDLKLKVCALIEKLSGPVIGLYCYELFPFTNYEFYLYVANCVKIFILLMGLFHIV
jgi:hypothetical protein